jgi:hypothetical protein
LDSILGSDDKKSPTIGLSGKEINDLLDGLVDAKVGGLEPS